MSLHLRILIRMSGHSLNVLTAASCVLKLASIGANTEASFAYHLLDGERLLGVFVYPFLRD